MSRPRFELLARDPGTAARRGRLSTAHGAVETPAFMPVGTAGTVKAMTPEEVAGLGYTMILGNTYHLALRPGEAVVARLGGLHRFMNWERGILTDSGGFQVLSLADRRAIDDDGVDFRSHLDGALLRMTPERSMEIQAALGSDVAMAFDDCPALPSPPERLREAVRRTTAWARRSRDAFDPPDRALFGIVQGGDDAALRAESAAAIVGMGFEGHAIGGVSVGESAAASRAVVAATAPLLPEAKPRYLMGMGTPADLVAMIGHGIDLFDCVLPTRNARNGSLFTATGRILIKQAGHRDDDRPIDATCDCEACRRYSRAYLRHLYMAGEILGLRLNTMHNLAHYARTMRDARRAIEAGNYAAFRDAFMERLAAGADGDDAASAGPGREVAGDPGG
ncbi:MAG TPA: tRNA guanosine(34) transglycosylase Tgt [Dongiaceae bacterium]|nr:tRNA guanosine(34) transglycosylase Tgt [Dongiaceae bacterium]